MGRGAQGQTQSLTDNQLNQTNALNSSCWGRAIGGESVDAAISEHSK